MNTPSRSTTITSTLLMHRPLLTHLLDVLHCFTVTASLLLLYCSTASLSLLHCYCFTVTASLLLLYCFTAVLLLTARERSAMVGVLLRAVPYLHLERQYDVLVHPTDAGVCTSSYLAHRSGQVGMLCWVCQPLMHPPTTADTFLFMYIYSNPNLTHPLNPPYQHPFSYLPYQNPLNLLSPPSTTVTTGRWQRCCSMQTPTLPVPA